ncbi:MAG: DUF6600 domain-containing protein [Bryobacteraceae bacterium]
MRHKLLAALIAIAALPLVAQDQQDRDEEDVPGRGVARMSLMNGDVTVRRGDSGDVTAAAINAPLMVEDRIYTGPGAHAEVQFDHANMIRLSANAEIRLSEIEQRRYTVQVARGLTTFRVLRDSESEVEISTPSVSVRPLRRGMYRIDVREDGTTEISVRSGEVEIFTPKGTERLAHGRTMIARGTVSDPEFQVTRAIPDDNWDSWNDRRDNELNRSRSYDYVSRDVYGAEDLDGHGRWVDVAPYGQVWTPYAAADWAPYRAGRWVWVDWYGWTWVSYDSWGWAPYHYGRWFYSAPHGWCWWPGGYRSRHFWRPALVSFFGWNSWGGVSFGVGLGFGRVGWCPLAPYEVFRPWYGRGYYGGYRNGGYYGNRTTIVNNINIYNTYRNARVHNGMSVIDGNDFRSGRVGNFHRVGESELRQASVVRGQMPMVPDRGSLRMSDREPGRINAQGAGQDRFFSRRAPAQVSRVSFDEQRRGMEQVTQRTFGDASHGGRGIDSGSRGTPSATRGVDGNAGPGYRADSPRSGAEAGRTADSADRGSWRRSGDSSSRTTDSGSRTADHNSGSSDNGGWRRFGEPSRNADAGSARGGADTSRRSDPGSRTMDRGTRGSDGSSDGGWRRFGEPSRGGSDGSRSQDPGSRTMDRGSRGGDSGSWRGGGDTSRGQDAGSRGQDSGSRTMDRGNRGGDSGARSGGDNSGSGRSGGDNSGSRGGGDGSRQMDRGSGRRSNFSDNGSDSGSWRRFDQGSSGDSGASSRRGSDSGGSSRGQSRSNSGGDSSIRISPPIVRERSTQNDAGRSSQRQQYYGGGGGYGGGSYGGFGGRSSGGYSSGSSSGTLWRLFGWWFQP